MSVHDSIATNTSSRFFSKLYKCCIQLGTSLASATTKSWHHITGLELDEDTDPHTSTTRCASGFAPSTDLLPV